MGVALVFSTTFYDHHLVETILTQLIDNDNKRFPLMNLGSRVPTTLVSCSWRLAYLKSLHVSTSLSCTSTFWCRVGERQIDTASWGMTPQSHGMAPRV